jgi:flagellar hook-basal body complex protein FliE
VIIPAIGVGPLGSSEWSVGGLGTSVPSPDASATAGSQNFGDMLSSAIGSLESSQTSATQAAQGLATGQITDPTQAITTVENASLDMDFASQLRNQIDTAATSLFQTQL